MINTGFRPLHGHAIREKHVSDWFRAASETTITSSGTSFNMDGENCRIYGENCPAYLINHDKYRVSIVFRLLSLGKAIQGWCRAASGTTITSLKTRFNMSGENCKLYGENCTKHLPKRNDCLIWWITTTDFALKKQTVLTNKPHKKILAILSHAILDSLLFLCLRS